MLDRQVVPVLSMEIVENMSSHKKYIVHVATEQTLFICKMFVLILLPLFVHAQPQGNDFWQEWGDGKAEVSSFILKYHRYEEQREGEAIVIFVNEEFLLDPPVKNEGKSGGIARTIPVMKTQVMKSFQTGVYEYHLGSTNISGITSGAGEWSWSPFVSRFSSQEWCGLNFASYLFGNDGISLELDSYFENRSRDKEITFDRSKLLAEDFLLTWARGLSQPFLEIGQRQKKVHYLSSLEDVTLRHQESKLKPAVVSRIQLADSGQERYSVEIAGNEYAHVQVDTEGRILSWNIEGVESAERVKIKRIPYWQLKRNSDAGSNLLSLGE